LYGAVIGLLLVDEAIEDACVEQGLQWTAAESAPSNAACYI
jgi:hypothetical protein